MCQKEVKKYENTAVRLLKASQQIAREILAAELGSPSAEVPAPAGEGKRIEALEAALEPFARFFKSELHDLSPASDATVFAAFQDQTNGMPLADLSIADVRRAWSVLNHNTKTEESNG